MAALSLLIVAVGFVRFGIDWWIYFHASSANTSSIQLNYRGLGGALSGIVMFVFFILIYRWRKY
jgi:uncharacterized BrkB/YihY/UPF0761 family membrane protein